MNSEVSPENGAMAPSSRVALSSKRSEVLPTATILGARNRNRLLPISTSWSAKVGQARLWSRPLFGRAEAAETPPGPRQGGGAPPATRPAALRAHAPPPLRLPRGVELDKEADAALALPLLPEPHHVAGLELGGRPDQRLPARAVKPFDQRRLDPGLACSADAPAGKLRWDDLGIVDD